MLAPGSQGSLLIAGDTRAGKSYLAGLLAERWIAAGYAATALPPHRRFYFHPSGEPRGEPAPQGPDRNRMQLLRVASCG